MNDKYFGIHSYSRDSLIEGETYFEVNFGSCKTVATVAMIDTYPSVDAEIELWVQSSSKTASTFTDTSKRCFTGGRNGVMSCTGVGAYLIAIAASSTGEWSFYEIFAWENKLLEVDVASLAFTGMTPSHSGGATLFGVTDPMQDAVDMALDGSEHKL